MTRVTEVASQESRPPVLHTVDDKGQVHVIRNGRIDALPVHMVDIAISELTDLVHVDGRAICD